MPPCLVASFCTVKNAETYLQEMGQIIEDTKRRSAPVMCLMKLDDSTVLNVEIADSNAMLADCVKIADHALTGSTVAGLLRAKIFTVGVEDRLKAFYDKVANPDAFEVTHMENPLGYFAPTCKGTSLYYFRVKKMVLKPEANMAEVLKLHEDAALLIAKEVGILSQQYIPFDDKTLYVLEVSTPKKWLDNFKAGKQKKELAPAINQISEKMASTDNFYYGKTSDMMSTVNAAVVRQSMFQAPGAKPGAKASPVTSKNLSSDEAQGWF